LYGAEIWGGNAFSKTSRTNVEAVALRFYKGILGLPKGAASAAVMLELCRIKMQEEALLSAIRYWFKLQSMPDTRLVKQCLIRQTSMANRGLDCWALRVKEALGCLGLAYLWELNIEGDPRIHFELVHQRMRDISRAAQIEEAKNCTSLTGYVSRKVHTETGQEYDDIFPSCRRWLAICRLKLWRSLPVQIVNGITKCEMCDETVESFDRDGVWRHFLAGQCSKTRQYAMFSTQDSFEDMQDIAICHPEYFVDGNKQVFKLLGHKRH
jgi:hypothetical protein